jgi:anti-sigma regulatory factor (Ser/Thr protein kinase)
VRSGAAAGHGGYFHETAFYGSDDDFLAVVVPFLEGGREAGEPTVTTLSDRNTALVRAALDDHDGIDFLPGAQRYDRPAATIRTYQELFNRHVAGGASQIRVVGDVPHPGNGMPWDGWARYEAVINHAFADFPLWGLCPYDTRTTPDHVLDEVARTHPHEALADGTHRVNDRFEDPSGFLARRRPPPPDPVQHTEPVVELVDPSARDTRLAVGALDTDLHPDEVDDLVTAVSEVVTNAVRYGVPPVRVRAWTAPGRAVVTVQDEGPGVDDPFAGLVPPRRAAGEGGLGLWIAHQISHVSLARTDAGFTVRLVAGEPHLAG